MMTLKLVVVFLGLSLCAAKPKNVLFLVVDDMRPQLGAYEGKDFPAPVHPPMHTPNLDKLAKRSLLLKRAFVQQALCSPSRTSTLTGRRPDTTRTHNLYNYWRHAAGNFTTIPQYFKEHGYKSLGMGKIFHPGHTSGGDDPMSWSGPYWHPNEGPFWSKSRRTTWHIANDTDVKSHPLEDMLIAERASQTLTNLTTSTQPFFLAVGFHRPHLPLLAPKKFYDLYPPEVVKMPANHYAPHKMPELAWSGNGELRQYVDFQDGVWYGAINDTLPDASVLALRRAYYACVSYTDSLIGEVLDTLRQLGLEDDTIVSFWGDHGWQLGEHSLWTKLTNFEMATHAPMMVAVPGLTDGGVETRAFTEFVDLFPTLAEVAGLPTIPQCPEDSSQVQVCTEGVSLVPLMKNATRLWKMAVFSQYPRMSISGAVIMGYTMRTEQYRYTEWSNVFECEYRPRWQAHSSELYDHRVDPEENENVVHASKYKTVRGMLSKQLHAGWRAALPPRH